MTFDLSCPDVVNVMYNHSKLILAHTVSGHIALQPSLVNKTFLSRPRPRLPFFNETKTETKT